MNLENVRMLELAAEHLSGLLAEVVFVGGATVELWITDQAAPEFRERHLNVRASSLNLTGSTH